MWLQLGLTQTTDTQPAGGKSGTGGEVEREGQTSRPDAIALATSYLNLSNLWFLPL